MEEDAVALCLGKHKVFLNCSVLRDDKQVIPLRNLFSVYKKLKL